MMRGSEGKLRTKRDLNKSISIFDSINELGILDKFFCKKKLIEKPKSGRTKENFFNLKRKIFPKMR